MGTKNDRLFNHVGVTSIVGARDTRPPPPQAKEEKMGW